MLKFNVFNPGGSVDYCFSILISSSRILSKKIPYASISIRSSGTGVLPPSCTYELSIESSESLLDETRNKSFTNSVTVLPLRLSLPSFFN